MSAGWAPLLPLAMVGTERQAIPMPTWPGAIGELAAQAAASAGQPASGVLRVAAVLASCALAGGHGAAWTGALPPPAVPDTWPTLTDPALSTLMAWTLQDGPARLQHTLCLALVHAQRRLPPRLLPQALDLGRRSIALRAVLLPALGERGLWLAAQRDEWRYAGGVSAGPADGARWDEGSLDQRRAFLQRERIADPPAARERLAAVLDELPAKERAELLPVLAHRLSLADEPLLDTLRADRSREVRQAALTLLLGLPDAAHPQRAIARLDALLTSQRILRTERWQIDAPSAESPDWKADNIDSARPKHESLGERAWWLYQLVRQVPLAWWTGRTGMTPVELIAWAATTDWAEALLRGWRDVLPVDRDADWCDAFLLHGPTVAWRDSAASVLALLPLARREHHWQRQLNDGTTALHAIGQQVLAACPPGETLSAPLSLRLADALRAHADSGSLRDDYALRGQLPELAAALHADALERLAQLAQQPDPSAAFADTHHAVADVIAVRRALHSLTINLDPAVDRFPALATPHER